jgi:hypothetical protein
MIGFELNKQIVHKINLPKIEQKRRQFKFKTHSPGFKEENNIGKISILRKIV